MLRDAELGDARARDDRLACEVAHQHFACAALVDLALDVELQQRRHVDVYLFGTAKAGRLDGDAGSWTLLDGITKLRENAVSLVRRERTRDVRLPLVLLHLRVHAVHVTVLFGLVMNPHHLRACVL